MKPLDVTFRQRVLSCSGFTCVIDGQWGPKTETADTAFNAAAEKLKSIGTFDLRTETTISTLLIQAQEKAREFMNVAGPTVKLLSGTRSYAEQDSLFSQRPKVTNARGGQSWHNFGLAFDVGIFIGGHYLTGANRSEEAEYDAIAVKIKTNIKDLEWGGDWTGGFKDKPHYQLTTGKTLSQARATFEAGKPFV